MKLAVRGMAPTPEAAAPPAGRPARLSLTSLAALYVLTLRQHLHGRRWMVMAVLFLLPAGLAILIRATAPDVPPMVLEFLLAFMFIPQALLPLVALSTRPASSRTSRKSRRSRTCWSGRSPGGRSTWSSCWRR